jgi:hypothetical protein
VLKPEHFTQSTDLELLANHIERRLWEKIPHIMNAQENHHHTILSALEEGRDKRYSSEHSELKVLAEIHRCANDDVKNIVQTFPSFIEAVKSIKKTGANVLMNNGEVSRHVPFNKQFAKSEFKLNYNIGFFILKK